MMMSDGVSRVFILHQDRTALNICGFKTWEEAAVYAIFHHSDWATLRTKTEEFKRNLDKLVEDYYHEHTFVEGRCTCGTYAEEPEE